MARFFAIVITLIFWPIVTLFNLIVGPFVWVYILLRSLVTYAVLMLLHAIASRELYASASKLEESITWYPSMLKNSIILLRSILTSERTIKGKQDSYIEDDDDLLGSVDENENGILEQFYRNAIKFFQWVVERLLPAFIVWVGIYFFFLALGVDLAAIVRGETKYVSIGIWIVGWLIIGVLGIIIMPLVRSVLVIPFVILIAVIWVFVGLVFWVPRFGFAALNAGVGSFLFVMTGGKSTNPVDVLTDAFLYYLDGFIIIFSILTNKEISEGEKPEEEVNKELKGMLRSLRISFLYLLIYIPIFILLIVLEWVPSPLDINIGGFGNFSKIDDRVTVAPPTRTGTSGTLANGLPCSFCPEMVVIPSGGFSMGSPASESGRGNDEGPVHWVSISYSFAASKYEVTFAEWDACVRDNGCGDYRPNAENWGRNRQPVINVSWYDAKTYVAWLSKRTGHKYRLLSEAEWEYAARAGTRTPFHFGATISTTKSNYDGRFRAYQRGRETYRKRTMPVGSFPSNAFGLHDVHGNVSEWVEDCWRGDYHGAPGNGRPRTWNRCEKRVLRGGSWFNSAKFVRSADRFALEPSARLKFHGFRIARTLQTI